MYTLSVMCQGPLYYHRSSVSVASLYQAVGKCFPYSMCPAIKVESSVWMKKIILELHAVVAPKLVIYVCLVHQHASFWKKESSRYEWP